MRVVLPKKDRPKAVFTDPVAGKQFIFSDIRIEMEYGSDGWLHGFFHCRSKDTYFRNIKRKTA